MPLQFLLDEHLRGGGLWHALRQHNAHTPYPFHAIRVGDRADLPLGSTDPDILVWAEREGYIFVSQDKKTLPGHLAAHLQLGHHSPGVFVIRSGCTVPQVVFFLALAAHAGDPAAYQDRIEYIP